MSKHKVRYERLLEVFNVNICIASDCETDEPAKVIVFNKEIIAIDGGAFRFNFIKKALIYENNSQAAETHKYHLPSLSECNNSDMKP